MKALTEGQARLVRDPNLAVAATRRRDGTLQQSVVWVDWDGEHVVFNTTGARAKARHLRRDPHVSVTVLDAGNPYRYVVIEGEAELDLAGAAEHMNAMSRKYQGTDWPDLRDRVIVRVRPQRVYAYGVD